MPKFKISAKTTVAKLKESFRKETGCTLHIYQGRSLAPDDATLVSLGAKKGELECRMSRTVGKFEKAFQNELNLKVKVRTKDDGVDVLDGITLAVAGQLPKMISINKMEEYLSYQRGKKDVDEPEEENDNESDSNLEDIPIIRIKTKEIDIHDRSTYYRDYITFGILFHGYESHGAQAAIIQCDDHEELCDEAENFIAELDEDEDMPVSVLETSFIKAYNIDYDIEELSGIIGCCLNEFYDGGEKHPFLYKWNETISEVIIDIEGQDLFIARYDEEWDCVEIDFDVPFSYKAIKELYSKQDGNPIFESSPKIGEHNDRSYIYDNYENVLTECELRFDNNGEFRGGLAPVAIDDKWGYIDMTGKMVIEPKFDTAEEFHYGTALVELNGKVLRIDKQGNIIDL